MTLPHDQESRFEKLFFAYSPPVFGLILLILGAWLMKYSPILGWLSVTVGGGILYRWSSSGKFALARSQASTAERVIVNVGSDGSIRILVDGPGSRLEGEAARRRLQALVRANPKLEVAIRTDPRTPSKVLVETISWLNQIGVAPVGGARIADL